VVKGAGLVMRAVIEEGDAEVAARMQDLALAEGALPFHLLTALFIQGTDGRVLTHRQLSRHLVGLWVTGHPTAMGLLKRIMVKSVNVGVRHKTTYARNKLDAGSIRISVTEVDGEEMKSFVI